MGRSGDEPRRGRQVTARRRIASFTISVWQSRVRIVAPGSFGFPLSPLNRVGDDLSIGCGEQWPRGFLPSMIGGHETQWLSWTASTAST
jgi:hypothetical protein